MNHFEVYRPTFLQYSSNYRELRFVPKGIKNSSTSDREFEFTAFELADSIKMTEKWRQIEGKSDFGRVRLPAAVRENEPTLTRAQLAGSSS